MKLISERAIELAVEFSKTIRRDYCRLEVGNLAQALDEYQREVEEWRAKVNEALSRAVFMPPPIPLIRSGDHVAEVVEQQWVNSENIVDDIRAGAERMKQIHRETPHMEIPAAVPPNRIGKYVASPEPISVSEYKRRIRAAVEEMQSRPVEFDADTRQPVPSEVQRMTLVLMRHGIVLGDDVEISWSSAKHGWEIE